MKLEKKNRSSLLHVVPDKKTTLLKISILIIIHVVFFNCLFQENMLRQNEIYIVTEKIWINCSFPFSSFINFKCQILNVLEKCSFYVVFFRLISKYMIFMVVSFRVLFYITGWHWQNIYTINSR